MSIEAVDYVFQNSKMTGAARLLMVAIASHATSKGYAFPGRERLTKYVAVQSRRITTLVQECERAGELAVVERSGKSNEYYILGLSGAVANARDVKPKPKHRALPRKTDKTPATGNTPATSNSTATGNTPATSNSTATGNTTTPATGNTTPLQPVAHESSSKGNLNRQSNSTPPTIPDASEALLRHYERCIGMLTPGLSMQLARLAFEYPEAWVKEALTITEDNHKNSLRYTEGVLKGFVKDGKPLPGAPKPRKPDTIGTPPYVPTPEELVEIRRILREEKPDFKALAKAGRA